MGKSIPITLPNGKSFKKKGEAQAYFKAMLNNYAIGAMISDSTDFNDLCALLAAYDAALPNGEPSKAGIGVSHFERRMDMDHPGHTTCFFVIRKDGTFIDFSYLKAIDAAAGS